MASTRLLLIRHATTAETRRAPFPATSGARPPSPAVACPALDRLGRAQASALAGCLPAPDRCWSSHAVRAIQTAELLGGPAPVPDPDLAECDFGAWAGLSPDAVHATDPAGLAAWYGDPDTAAHGGESLAAVRERAARVLTRAADAGGTTWAVSHGGLIKAALLGVLDLPAAAVWRLDAGPASVTELHHTGAGGTWRVTLLNWTHRPAGWPATTADMDRGTAGPPGPGPGAEAPQAPGSGPGTGAGSGTESGPDSGASSGPGSGTESETGSGTRASGAVVPEARGSGPVDSGRLRSDAYGKVGARGALDGPLRASA